MRGGKNGPRAIANKMPKAPKKGKGQGQKKPAAPKTKARQVVRTRGFSLLSPLNPAVVPTTRCFGKSLPVSAVCHDELTMNVGNRVMYLINNNGVSATLMVKITAAGGVMTDPGKSTFMCEVLKASSTLGGPTSGRAMKAGVSIVNNTPVLDAGGRIYVLNADQRIALPDDVAALTLAEFNTLCDQVKQNPHRRILDGADFKSPKHFHTHVTDPVTYEQFDSWRGTLSVSDFGAYLSEYPGTPDKEKRSMSTLIVIMEPAAKQQDYTVTARGMWVTRWPLNSIGAFVSKDAPTAPLQTIDNAFKDGAATANPPPK